MNPYIENKDGVISFDLLKVERGRKKICQCKTPHYELDIANRIVICKDCGAIIDPFDAMINVAMHMERYTEYQKDALSQIKAYREMANKEYRRRMKNAAFKNMDANYREGLFPLCPVCGEQFDPMEIRDWCRKLNS